MGTNYYLCKKDEWAFYGEARLDPSGLLELCDGIHIAKVSAGRKPLFEAHAGLFESVGQLKREHDEGGYVIVDEYGDEHTWKRFNDLVLKRAARQDGAGAKCKSHVAESPHSGIRSYDVDGHDFTMQPFC